MVNFAIFVISVHAGSSEYKIQLQIFFKAFTAPYSPCTSFDINYLTCIFVEKKTLQSDFDKTSARPLVSDWHSLIKKYLQFFGFLEVIYTPKNNNIILKSTKPTKLAKPNQTHLTIITKTDKFKFAVFLAQLSPRWFTFLFSKFLLENISLSFSQIN